MCRAVIQRRQTKRDDLEVRRRVRQVWLSMGTSAVTSLMSSTTSPRMRRASRSTKTRWWWARCAPRRPWRRGALGRPQQSFDARKQVLIALPSATHPAVRNHHRRRPVRRRSQCSSSPSARSLPQASSSPQRGAPRRAWHRGRPRDPVWVGAAVHAVVDRRAPAVSAPGRGPLVRHETYV